jgi:hypothetical protein
MSLPENTYPCSPMFDPTYENPEDILRLEAGSSIGSSYSSSSSSSDNGSRKVKTQQATNNSLAKHSGGIGEDPDIEKDINKELDTQNSKNSEFYQNFMRNFKGGKK